MSTAYIVIGAGCVQFVSSTDPTLRVVVLDKDYRDEQGFTDGPEFDMSLERAEKLVRVW